MNNKKNNTEEERQLRLINSRLEGLINSTVDSNIKLEKGDKWAYNTKTKTIIYPVDGDDGVKQLPSEVFIGVLLHEVGHAKYTQDINLDVIPDPKKDYALLLNCLEDVRVERQLMNRYPGTYDNLRELQTHSDKYYDEETLKTQFPPHINLLLNIIRGEWGEETHFTNENVEKFFNDNYDLIQEAVSKDTSKELQEYIDEVLWKKFVKLIPPKKEDDKKKDDKKEDDKKEEGEGEGGEGSGGEGSGDGDGKENEKEKKKQELINKAINKDDITKALKGEDKKRTKKKASAKSLMAKMSKKPEKSEDVQDLAKSDLLKEAKERAGDRRIMSYEEMYGYIKDYLRYFSSKLDSILIDNNLKRFGGAYKSGKLNKKLLYKWKCNNTRLFSRPVLRKHKKYSICLLVDESGSMYGSNIRETSKAVVLLSEVLNKIGIPFEVSGFNGTNRVYKNYDEPYNWKIKRNLEAFQIEVHSYEAKDNNDGFSVNWANHRLQQREGEKIMLVLSDGSPVNSWDQIPLEDQRRLPSTLRKYNDFDLKTEIRKVQKNAVIIGVGLGGDGVCVEKFYTQHVVCNDVTNISKVLLGVLNKQIKRG
jgi:uncharacterized protein with von Willebrand factor type A (vWA) domain